LADNLENYLRAPDDLDRIIIRGQVTDGEASLASTAKQAASSLRLLPECGYRGMYNQNYHGSRN